MNSGSIALAHNSVEEIDSFVDTIDKNGLEATVSVEVRETISDLSGKTLAYAGVAAEQFFDDSEIPRVNEETNSISLSESNSLTWKYTQFLLIPDKFIILGGGGDFALEIFRSQFGIGVDDAGINLRSYLQELNDQHQELDSWKVGFYGRESNANNGVLHGNDLLNDGELGGILVDNPPNQLGLTFEKDGKRMKVLATESGYVEVYRPSDFDTVQYVQFIKEDITPHLRTEM